MKNNLIKKDKKTIFSSKQNNTGTDTIDTINNLDLKKLLLLRTQINQNLEWGFNGSTENLIKGLLLINPQSYGARLEKYAILKIGNGAQRVDPKLNRGDCKLNNKYIEIKSSIITDKGNDSLNMVQIRLYQNVDYYLCVAYDISDIDNFKQYTFLLSHDEMVEEMKKVNATSAHGTKEMVADNENVELRYSLKIKDGDDVFERWKNKYFVKNGFDDIAKIVKQ